MTITADEMRRYARHLSLPEVGLPGQLKLKSAKVLVVGAGGLGHPVALYLAAAGVGTLGLMDGDHISFSNLQRQVLFATDQVGQGKVEVLAKRLEALNPDVAIQSHSHHISAHNAADFLTNYDLVVDCTDNFQARYLLNDACVAVQKPLVFGAISRFDGQVSVFAVPGGPCYRCLYPEPPPIEAVPNCAESGVLGVLPGVVGTLMATEALKLILQIGEPLVGTMLFYDALAANFSRLSFEKNLQCTGCGPLRIQKTLKGVKDFCALDKVELKSLKAQFPHLILLDVRSMAEAKESPVTGALLVPLDQLARQASGIPKDQPVIAICQSGRRSARALEILSSAGFKNLRHLAGGLDHNPEIEI